MKLRLFPLQILSAMAILGLAISCNSVLQPELAVPDAGSDSRAIAGNIYASPSGKATNTGSKTSPLNLETALTALQAGSTIYLMNGTYAYNRQITIARTNSGTASAKKTIRPDTGATVTLDFSSQAYGNPSSVTNPRGLQIDGSYWQVVGLKVKGSADNGIYVAGNYNTIERCETFNNRDTGLQLGRYQAGAAKADWPKNNTILNCDSHDNMDPDNGEDADGFACKLTTGPNNKFIGCVSWNNVDDGWDLYTKSDTGPIDPVYFERCVAFKNGQTSSGAQTANSDGNGFKLGGDKIKVNHIVTQCVAFNNKKHGFTYNSNPGSISMTNCTSFNNGRTSGSNFAFDSGTHIFKNLVSWSNATSPYSSSDKFAGTDNGSNVWYKDKKTYSKNGNLAASNADFVSLSLPSTIARNASGYPVLGNFLKLAAGSDLTGLGYTFN